jgi:hypothetical protein
MEKPESIMTNYVTTDEEFHDMLKELHSVDAIRSPVMPLRKYRADRITAEIMQIIDKHLRDNQDALERNTMRYIHRDILDMFFKADVDVVTEIDRIDAGLPRHNAYGYTKEEMRIMELHRQKKMLEAMHSIFVVPEGKAS